MMNKQRLEAFTDAILAIIMTIMVLEIHAPHGITLHAMAQLALPALAYIISFIGIMNLWATHHDIFEHTKRISHGVFLANMAVVLWLSFLPAATAWVAEYPTAFLPQATFMILQLGWTMLLLNLERAARKANPGDNLSSLASRGIYFTITLQVIGLILSAFLPYVALIVGTFIILIYLGDEVPMKVMRRLHVKK